LDWQAETKQAFEPAVGPVTDRLAGTYEERLNRILAAATQIIAKVGYQRASMRGVARMTGMSLAGLYHYVPNKERMLFLVQYRTFNALVNNLREKLLGVDDPVEQLRVMVRTHVGYFAANIAALKVCSHELDSLSGESYDETFRIRREYYLLVRGIVDRLLGELAADGSIDPHIATMSLFGMLNWLYRWYDPKRGRAPATVAQQLASEFLYGLRGAGAAAPAPEPTAPA
jgi:AcrR family transcriptional regulator